MRLEKLKQGNSLKAKLLFWVIRRSTKAEPFDVIKTLVYRPRFFGGPYNQLLQASLRGESRWSIGERELFAAFTSRLNQCLF